jgi:hypothetical protein
MAISGRKLTVRSQVKIARNGHSLELLLPADLKGTAPVRAFFEVVGEELVRERKMPLVFRMGNPGRMIRLTKGCRARKGVCPQRLKDEPDRIAVVAAEYAKQQ